jgi:bifunctional non-homologous end joining protein LigD
MARKGDAALLAEYNRKRDFGKTAEPEGKVAENEGFSFCIQKHAATRLHYDFRLELDGVLKSWAVTKGPSLNPAERRLAVHTEDHPLDYGGFEGTIPKGEYGGGTVMLWDRGTWEPVSDPHKGLEEGRLKFRLHGERLNGGWNLVRMPPRPKEKRDNWLLIKERDETADEADPILEEFTTSVSTGRSMEEIATGNSAVWHSNREPKTQAEEPAPAAKPRRRKTKGLALPEFRPPQLATLAQSPPEGPEWVHEFKYDGYRLLIAANGSEVRCYTRNALDWTQKFRPIAAAFAAMDLPGCLVDGEVVSFSPDGRTDFSTLQKALKEGGELQFFAFDLLQENRKDLAPLALLERKKRLQALFKALPKGSPLHVSLHVTGSGQDVLDQICKAGHEGIISKRAGAPYRGERNRDWLKIKCSRRQEFVIGGWTPSEKRQGFKSLIVGTWENGKLVYKGRVGTGFDDKTLDELSARFKPLARKDHPFESIPRELRRSKWIEPELVAEVEFAEFTADGILRHPSFQGLREDKESREVHMEVPAPVAEAPAEKPAPADSKPKRGPADEGADIQRAGVRVTSPGKVIFPRQKIIKREVIDYYEAIGELMLPHLTGRPLSLVRCPQGLSRKCFYQKHDSGGFPSELRRVMITENSGETEEYFYIEDLPGIIAGVQMNALEFHVWGSRVDQLEKPDRIVIDLDPDEGLGFEDVRRAAFDLRDRLQDIGLKTFPMLSGGKGFHLVAPLTRRAQWPEVKAFCHGFALQLEEQAPDRYIANMSKARRKGRIFVDYLRNERGSTAIAPYSTRARDNAPVSAPITWDEVKTVTGANIFTIRTMPERARSIGDPWEGYFETKQSITKAMMRAVKAE